MTTAIANISASTDYETLLIQLAQAMKAEDRGWADQVRQAMERPERDLDDAMMPLKRHYEAASQAASSPGVSMPLYPKMHRKPYRLTLHFRH